MRTAYPGIVAIAILFIFHACTTGIERDISSGLTVVNKNMTYDKSYIDQDGEVMRVAEVSRGSRLNLFIEGVSGFAIENGKAFPGCSVLVTDKEGHHIMEYKDLFDQYSETGASVVDVGILNASLSIGHPMETGETYNWKTRFWDKRGKGEIVASIDLSVIE